MADPEFLTLAKDIENFPLTFDDKSIDQLANSVDALSNLFNTETEFYKKINKKIYAAFTRLSDSRRILRTEGKKLGDTYTKQDNYGTHSEDIGQIWNFMSGNLLNSKAPLEEAESYFSHLTVRSDFAILKNVIGRINFSLWQHMIALRNTDSAQAYTNLHNLMTAILESCIANLGVLMAVFKNNIEHAESIKNKTKALVKEMKNCRKQKDMIKKKHQMIEIKNNLLAIKQHCQSYYNNSLNSYQKQLDETTRVA
ncbi:MAG: hypothetical protein AABX51_06770 [Nanoarchaeota archaeon]